MQIEGVFFPYIWGGGPHHYLNFILIYAGKSKIKKQYLIIVELKGPPSLMVNQPTK